MFAIALETSSRFPARIGPNDTFEMPSTITSAIRSSGASIAAQALASSFAAASFGPAIDTERSITSTSARRRSIVSTGRGHGAGVRTSTSASSVASSTRCVLPQFRARFASASLFALW
jgi:hypothetical protein